jgi:ABC-type amino acid transport substrate-binding protein
MRLNTPSGAAVLFLAAWLALSDDRVAAAEPRDASTPPLRVALVDSPPFAIKGGDSGWSGLGVELWREIAAELGVRWEPREIELHQVNDLLREGAVDAALGAVALSAEGELAHDFSHPYCATGLSFAARTVGQSSWDPMLDALTSSGLLRLIGWIALATLVMGIVITFVERRHRDTEFGGSLRRGIGIGVWWAAVTMTTVGSGDATPKTAPGRSLALLWMVFGLVAVALFTATVTSLLTVSHLEGRVQRPADLFHIRLGAIAGGAGAVFLTDHHATFRAYDDYEQALAALADRQVDAVVANGAVLRYEVSRRWQGTLRTSPLVLEPLLFAIGLPPGSPLREPIDRALLRITAQDRWREIERQYLGHP